MFILLFLLIKSNYQKNFLNDNIFIQSKNNQITDTDNNRKEINNLKNEITLKYNEISNLTIIFINIIKIIIFIK